MLLSSSVSRNLRVLALMLGLFAGLAGSAYSQALVHYGAAATTGAAAGTAAGKKLSDALTKAMDKAADAAKQGEQTDADKKAAEKKPADKKDAAKGDVKPSEPVAEKSAAKPSSIPSAADAAPLPFRSVRRSAARSDAALVATATRAGAEFDAVTGRPKRGRRIAVAPVAEEVETSAVALTPDALADIPLTMREVLTGFHPTLAPLGERLQRITKGTPREDVRRILGAPASKVTIPGDRDIDEIYYYQERGHNVATVRIEAGLVTRVNTEF